MADRNNHSEHYDKNSFVGKVTSSIGSVAYQSLRQVVALYHCAQDPETPAWAKTVIIAALGYFIAPLDALPDITPLVGFTDDWGVVGLAILQLGTSLKQTHYDAAQDFLNTVLPNKTEDLKEPEELLASANTLDNSGEQ